MQFSLLVDDDVKTNPMLTSGESNCDIMILSGVTWLSEYCLTAMSMSSLYSLLSSHVCGLNKGVFIYSLANQVIYNSDIKWKCKVKSAKPDDDMICYAPILLSSLNTERYG